MKERFIYIDIFRGLCMFVVIYSHILLFSIGYPQTSLLTDFLRGFFLNSFFFISGFLSYKETNWNLSNTKRFIIKKIMTLFIPTLTCLGIFCFFMNGNYINALLGSSKSGYWFTFTLFEMFFIYAIFAFFTNRVKNITWKTILLLFLAIISYLIKKTFIEEGFLFNILSLNQLLYYFPLFLLGIICKVNVLLFPKIIKYKIIKILLLIIVCLELKTHCIPLIIYNISATLLVYYIIKDSITTNSSTSIIYKYGTKLFQRIGQNTLPIYFLHYFILFKYPNAITQYMQSLYSDFCFASHSCAGFIELIIIGTTSILIALTCIYITKILNYIPYINILMFGINTKDMTPSREYNNKK